MGTRKSPISCVHIPATVSSPTATLHATIRSTSAGASRPSSARRPSPASVAPTVVDADQWSERASERAREAWLGPGPGPGAVRTAAALRRLARYNLILRISPRRPTSTSMATTNHHHFSLMLLLSNYLHGFLRRSTRSAGLCMSITVSGPPASGISFLFSFSFSFSSLISKGPPGTPR